MDMDRARRAYKNDDLGENTVVAFYEGNFPALSNRKQDKLRE